MRSRPGFVVPHLSASFVPTDIAGCVAWYDASDAGSITESSGSVSQWNDLSGNDRHLSQGTGSLQPITGTRTQNSLNVLDFDGSNDYLQSTSFSVSQPITVFAVALTDTIATGTRALWDTVAGRILFYKRNSEGTWQIFAGGEVNGASYDTSPHVHCGVYNGASSAVYQDDGAGATGNVGSQALTSGIILGAWQGALTSFCWDGWIGEVIYYNSALGTTDRETVRDHLMTKWGI